MLFEKLDCLRTLNFIIPKIPEIVNYNRLNFSSNSNLIDVPTSVEFQYKDKSYIFITSNIEKKKASEVKTYISYLNLKPEELEKYPFLHFTAYLILKSLIEVDLLFNCLPDSERESNYPKFYKNQISFIIKYVKHQIIDYITTYGESEKSICYGLTVEKECETFCKLLVGKCFIKDGNRDYVVCPEQDNEPYPYKKELALLEAEVYFPLTAIH